MRLKKFEMHYQNTFEKKQKCLFEKNLKKKIVQNGNEETRNKKNALHVFVCFLTQFQCRCSFYEHTLEIHRKTLLLV